MLLAYAQMHHILVLNILYLDRPPPPPFPFSKIAGSASVIIIQLVYVEDP